MTDTHLLDTLRNYTVQMKYVFVLSGASIVLLSFSLAYVRPGTSTYTLAIFQLTTFVLLFVLMGSLLWLCSRR